LEKHSKLTFSSLTYLNLDTARVKFNISPKLRVAAALSEESFFPEICPAAVTSVGS
jgi:hypothetical protein